MALDVLSGWHKWHWMYCLGGISGIGCIVWVAERALDVLSGWQKGHWMYCPNGRKGIGCIVRVANLCGMFCFRWQIMA